MVQAESKFVRNFGSARKALHLTQAQVGARMRARCMPGWTERTVRNLEEGRRSPRVHEAEALAAIVCVPLDRLITESAAWCADRARDNMLHGRVVV